MEKDNLIAAWKNNFLFKEAELKAFREVPRENFVPDEFRTLAYEDIPLPLLRGKTISQPTTVMIMTSALELSLGEKVLEVGTGSGYQSAIIANIVGRSGQVLTTEVIPELVLNARKNLAKSNIKNVEVYEEDGSKGILPYAPFDKIIITAAAKEFPEELIEQLKGGGIIVAPLGSADAQEMIKAVKLDDGSLEYESLGSFLFTPLYGKYGFEI